VASGAMEIITGRERRRRWSIEEKLRIVAETREAGVRVTDVAARTGVYPSLLFHWRRQVREGILCPAPPARFTPVRITSGSAEPAPGEQARNERVRERRNPGVIEITLPNGCRLRIDQQVDVHALRRIVGALGG
jgi:transposase